MFKVLLLQQWYGLSDFETEKQISDRIFMKFFRDFLILYLIPGRYGFFASGWPRQERMSLFGKSSRDSSIFKGLQVRRGTIQDATVYRGRSRKFKETQKRER